MVPTELNIEEFAKNLAEQASQALPPDLPENVKKIVIQTVYEYIKIAGNALNSEANNYTQDETILICQLVGEWMYHKGIDNYKNQIPEGYWKPILEQLAFAIFEVSKNSVIAKDTPTETIDKAQAAVETAYRTMMEKLAAENQLTKSVDEIMHQSNLNDYVEQNFNETPEDPKREEKDLKLMTMALFFKNLAPEAVGKLVKMLGEDERRQLGVYINMPDLEKLVDPVIYNNYLEKFNNFMPKVQQRKSKKSMYDKFSAAFSSVTEGQLLQLISNERKNVKNFLLRVYNGKMSEEELFPLDLANEIINYTVQKVNSK